ncbi:MAG TPA: hypothetical protein VD866_16905 [Urbifossiella sp.]|nr:hypothetical protein [Urbifossiella sp.]
MLIWQGFGIVVAVVPAALFGLAQLALRAAAPDGPPAGLKDTATLLAFLGSAVLWPIGRLLHADDRPPFDPATGRENPPVARHALFWVPVEFWGVILPIFGFFAWLGR